MAWDTHGPRSSPARVAASVAVCLVSMLMPRTVHGFRLSDMVSHSVLLPDGATGPVGRLVGHPASATQAATAASCSATDRAAPATDRLALEPLVLVLRGGIAAPAGTRA